MGRAPCCEKVGLKKGKWTAEEDEILIKYIHANGEGSWRSLPKKAGLLRCGKSCRLRWVNYLKDNLKRGNITAEEEELIVKLHNSLGNRWSLIASHLQGRTDNEIKNYWNSHLRKKIYCFRKVSKEPHLPVTNEPCKRRRVSPSATKKHTLVYTKKSQGTTKNDAPTDTSQEKKDSHNAAAGPLIETQGSAINEEANPVEVSTDMHDSLMQSAEPGVGGPSKHEVVALCPSRQPEVDDMLETYEWLDNELRRLSTTFQENNNNDINNSNTIYNNNDDNAINNNNQSKQRELRGDVDATEGGNLFMGLVAEEMTASEEIEGLLSSTLVENRDELFTSSSSVSSSIDDKWMEWDWEDGLKILDFDFCEGEDAMGAFLGDTSNEK